MVPTWWIVGVAVFVPMFLWAVVHGVISGEDELGTAIACMAFFLAAGVASGFFSFG